MCHPEEEQVDLHSPRTPGPPGSGLQSLDFRVRNFVEGKQSQGSKFRGQSDARRSSSRTPG